MPLRYDQQNLVSQQAQKMNNRLTANDIFSKNKDI